MRFGGTKTLAKTYYVWGVIGLTKSPISASRYCNHITMADYLTSNRHEIEKFVQQAEDGFQWKHYFQFLGVLELDMNVDAIATRTRNAIKVRTYNLAT